MAFTLPADPELGDSTSLGQEDFIWTGAQWSNREATRQVIVSDTPPIDTNIAERDTYWYDHVALVLKHYDTATSDWADVTEVAPA